MHILPAHSLNLNSPFPKLLTNQVNVYSVGLYLESGSLSKLKGFKGKSKEALAKDSGYYAVLQKPGLHR